MSFEKNVSDLVKAQLTAQLENIFAALICGTSSIVNIFFTVCAVYFMVTLKTLRSQFAYLCVSLAVADGGNLLVWLFWTTPFIIIQDPHIPAETVLGQKIGHLVVTLMWCSQAHVLVIAINRLVAITSVKYEEWFSTRNTVYLIVAVWVSAFVQNAFFFVDGCLFYFWPPFYKWGYDGVNCPFGTAFYIINIVPGFLLGLVVFIVNMTTLAKLRKRNQVQATNRALTEAERAEIQRRRKKQISFFYQSLLNSSILILMLGLISINIQFFMEYKWSWFISSIMAWNIGNGSNGYILMFMNKEIREKMAQMLCCLKKNETTVSKK